MILLTRTVIGGVLQRSISMILLTRTVIGGVLQRSINDPTNSYCDWWGTTEIYQ